MIIKIAYFVVILGILIRLTGQKVVEIENESASGIVRVTAFVARAFYFGATWTVAYDIAVTVCQYLR